MQTSSSKLLALAGAAIFLVAAKKPSEFEPTFAPPPPVAEANGSIFQASRGYAPLTSGTRAASVGDLLTIVLVERTQATKTSAANTGRSGEIASRHRLPARYPCLLRKNLTWAAMLASMGRGKPHNRTRFRARSA
jgi:flagellar basal body L-ring protein FlgH